MCAQLSPRIQKSDTGMNAGITAIDNSVADCEKVRVKAEALRVEMNDQWAGSAGTAFNQKLDEWLRNYYLVIQELRTIKDLVTSSNTAMNTTENDNYMLSVKAFGDVSAGVYKGVTGA
ncbi:WXG100 family type VII secretion target [Lentzea alba]|uniref:WXG100 family type VII secretion target n=1 Tax=Lentzea alba TaxID=2714351 RepID=UPI0039BF2935